MKSDVFLNQISSYIEYLNESISNKTKNQNIKYINDDSIEKITSMLNDIALKYNDLASYYEDLVQNQNNLNIEHNLPEILDQDQEETTLLITEYSLIKEGKLNLPRIKLLSEELDLDLFKIYTKILEYNIITT